MSVERSEQWNILVISRRSSQCDHVAQGYLRMQGIGCKDVSRAFTCESRRLQSVYWDVMVMGEVKEIDVRCRLSGLVRYFLD